MTTAFFLEMIRMEAGRDAGPADQLVRLQARLESLGKRVIVTREPGGSAYGETIRAYLQGGRSEGLPLLAEALLLSAARIDHLDDRIGPALREGVQVLSDRLVQSTRTYQTLCGDVEKSLGSTLERVVSNGMRPDLTLFLDQQPEPLTVDQGALPSDLDVMLRKALFELAKVEPSRYVVVYARGSQEEVAEAVWDEVRTRLPKLAAPNLRSFDVA